MTSWLPRDYPRVSLGRKNKTPTKLGRLRTPLYTQPYPFSIWQGKNVLENLRFRFGFVSGFSFRPAKQTQTQAHKHTRLKNELEPGSKVCKTAREILSVYLGRQCNPKPAAIPPTAPSG